MRQRRGVLEQGQQPAGVCQAPVFDCAPISWQTHFHKLDCKAQQDPHHTAQPGAGRPPLPPGDDGCVWQFTGLTRLSCVVYSHDHMTPQLLGSGHFPALLSQSLSWRALASVLI